MLLGRLNQIASAFLLALCSVMVSSAASAQPSFQEAFDKHGAVMLLIDPQSGAIVDANAAASNYYGYSRATLTGMAIQDINQFTPEQVAEERRLAETEGRNFFIFRHKLANGEIRTVEVHSVPLDFDGRTLLYSIINDISKERSLQDDLWHYQTRLEEMVAQKTMELDLEHAQRRYILIASVIGLSVLVVLLLVVMRLRQRSDKALRTSEMKQRSILNSAAEGIYGLDSQGRCTFCNPACVQMLGYADESELLGQAMHDLIHHTHPDGTPHAAEDCPIFSAYTQGKAAHTTDDVFWRKDGSSFPIEYWAHPLFEDGELVGTVLSFIDISERKRAERQLMEAKQNAEAANRAKSDFLASMSHDLRTPLNAILGFAQLLEMDTQAPLTGKQKEQVERILDGGHHLLTLVNDLLDLAKVETDQVTIFLEELPANAVVTECAELAENLGAERDITVHNEMRGQPDVMIRTDRQRLMQILLNLLTNAIKFNRHGGTVTISGEALPTDYLRISVADTGIGIPAGDKDNVFQMFHRLENDPMLAHDGSGIGLTVSRMLAERLGGQVGFESEVGVGSVFWVDIPLATNTEILVWSDAIRIGLEPLDRDHQTLIALLNKLSLNGGDNETTERVIDEIEEYTRYHFRREELVMEVCGFPKLDEHRQGHQAIIEKINDLATQWRRAKDRASKDAIQHFLREWLAGHIMVADHQLAACVKGQEDSIKAALQNARLL